MACYHPLKGFILGTNPATGKNRLKITPYVTDHVELRKDGKYYNCVSSDDSPFSTSFRDSVDIPCGRCIGCRLAKSREWANRNSVELQNYSSNYFITLTYDDDHLPIRYVIDPSDPDSGNLLEVQTLYKRDWQLFMKRLRFACGDHKLRFYMAGEYGSKCRPHYHAIIFNLEIPDLKPYKQNELGDQLYTSDWLNSLWKTEEDKEFGRPKGQNGYVVIGEVTWETIAYVARYTTKKLYGKEADLYRKFNLEPEFSLMSRKPGIGRDYYESIKEEIEEQDHFYIPSKRGARPFTIPRYFRDLYYVEFPDRMDAIKEQNIKVMEDYKQLKENRSSLPYIDLLEIEEYNLEKKTKVLRREL